MANPQVSVALLQSSGYLDLPCDVPFRQGPPKVLTDHEEEQLLEYCINMQKLGFGLTKSGVNHCIMEILNSWPPFSEDSPGKNWWKCFMRDSPNLSFRGPQELYI
ncbi:hypothetical protein BC937DRAFT_86642 [Endogone sp. FLAS-F59071]|nr:hypothetical protein BC937DRAFT_86642 [Endogone sp. FLAS-F59071]|eukprot:RUS19966.1 hypothetical protein BC937DRAFT_86642 [Endogone sp. FLAS-F59071]